MLAKHLLGTVKGSGAATILRVLPPMRPAALPSDVRGLAAGSRFSGERRFASAVIHRRRWSARSAGAFRRAVRVGSSRRLPPRPTTTTNPIVTQAASREHRPRDPRLEQGGRGGRGGALSFALPPGFFRPSAGRNQRSAPAHLRRPRLRGIERSHPLDPIAVVAVDRRDLAVGEDALDDPDVIARRSGRCRRGRRRPAAGVASGGRTQGPVSPSRSDSGALARRRSARGRLAPSVLAAPIHRSSPSRQTARCRLRAGPPACSQTQATKSEHHSSHGP